MLTTKLKFGRNTNGLKVIKVTFPDTDVPGFSVQTNGNMPKTHNLSDLYGINLMTAFKELKSYVTDYGTPTMKDRLFIKVQS